MDQHNAGRHEAGAHRSPRSFARHATAFGMFYSLLLALPTCSFIISAEHRVRLCLCMALQRDGLPYLALLEKIFTCRVVNVTKLCTLPLATSCNVDITPASVYYKLADRRMNLHLECCSRCCFVSRSAIIDDVTKW
jgi:hypothetical protein